MLDTDFVLRALQRLDNNLEILKQISGISLDQFLSDPLQHGSAERYLQVSIEICLDITRHIVSTEALGDPKTHAEAFALLSRAQIIPANFLSTMQRMAGFRNRLEHLYWDIEQETVHEILQTQLKDFDLFHDCIVAYLSQRGLI